MDRKPGVVQKRERAQPKNWGYHHCCGIKNSIPMEKKREKAQYPPRWTNAQDNVERKVKKGLTKQERLVG